MDRIVRASLCSLAVLLCVSSVLAHGGGDHAQIVVAPDADWATRHMAEEHHISGFDPTTFFNLHDYDGTGSWTRDDIRRTYGLTDESSSSIPETKKQMVAQTILDMYDSDRDSLVSLSEFLAGVSAGHNLPDFGMGPGHHGDDEYEYEIHHFEKYHSGDDVKEEDLNHPEDIEHFRKHEEMERRMEEWEALEGRGVVEKNIPGKYRRN